LAVSSLLTLLFLRAQYGSVADFADEVPSTGRPLLLLSTLERNIVNLAKDPRASLAIRTPDVNCSDMMTCPRVTLFGTLSQVPAKELPAAKSAYLDKHPSARGWIDFPDFSMYRMDVLDLYYVGGFGDEHYIGYIGPRAYLESGDACK
jgi:putative heme iron utilization protein